MTESKLFCVLPDYVCTPDGMAIDRYGNLVLSCPNYAQDDLSGCVVKIDKDGNVNEMVRCTGASGDGGGPQYGYRL